jgi:hypothetical protein
MNDQSPSAPAQQADRQMTNFGSPQILIPDTQPVSLDMHRNLHHTGEPMMVFQDEHGHLYPRDDEFELIPGLTPGFTTNGVDFEPAGDPIRKVGTILTVPTIETDVMGNPLGIATSGIEGGFEDVFNRTGPAARSAVAKRNERIDGGETGAQLL